MRAREEISGSHPLLVPGAASAVLIGDDRMWPTIRQDSIVFLAEPGFSGEGIYSISQRNPADLWRISFVSDGWVLTIDNGLERWTIGASEAQRLGLHRVVGVCNPFARDFALFLRSQFEGVPS